MARTGRNGKEKRRGSTDLKALILASNDFDYRDTDDGIEVAWLRTDPPTIMGVRSDVGDRLEPHEILLLCKDGRDVTQITRVTGYFSKVAGWNRAKQRELQDRHRVTVGASPSSFAKP